MQLHTQMEESQYIINITNLLTNLAFSVQCLVHINYPALCTIHHHSNRILTRLTVLDVLIVYVLP